MIGIPEDEIEALQENMNDPQLRKIVDRVSIRFYRDCLLRIVGVLEIGITVRPNSLQVKPPNDFFEMLIAS